MPILMLSIITQVSIFGHNSLQTTYLLADMVNQLICNTLLPSLPVVQFIGQGQWGF